MSLWAPTRRFDPNCPEIIDDPKTAPALLREELGVLEKLNRRLGGCALILNYAERLLAAAEPKSLTVLDLGTGAADIPRAFAAWARTRQIQVSITGADRNPEVLRFARETCADWPEIRLEQQDLRALPYAKGSFDLVFCSLTLHHLGREEAVGMLRRMREIARIGYVLSDLRRSWAAVWAAELLARTIVTSEVLARDGTQSCRAAFTVGELRAMATEAGLSEFRIHRHQGVFRMVLEGRKAPKNHG